HGVRITRIRPGRPQSNGHVEALHRLILEECWRPAFARYLHLRLHGLRRELPAHLPDYNHDPAPPPPPPPTPPPPAPTRAAHTRPHPRRHRLRCPQDGAEMSRTCRHISES